VGSKRQGLQRAVFTGLVPFEMLTMRALPDGFELEFSVDLDPASATELGSYRMSSYTYAYHADYGAPESDSPELELLSATLAGPRRVRLSVTPLRAGYVHELSMPGLACARRDAAGAREPLLHTEAYYTLMRIPAAAGEAR
jgi:hypothetical protein